MCIKNKLRPFLYLEYIEMFYPVSIQNTFQLLYFNFIYKARIMLIYNEYILESFIIDILYKYLSSLL